MSDIDKKHDICPGCSVSRVLTVTGFCAVCNEEGPLLPQDQLESLRAQLDEVTRERDEARASEGAWRSGAMEVLDELHLAGTTAEQHGPTPALRVRALARQRDQQAALAQRLGEALRKINEPNVQALGSIKYIAECALAELDNEKE